MILGATEEMVFLSCWVTVMRQLIFVFSCRNYEEKYYFIRNTENFCIPMNYFVVIS